MASKSKAKKSAPKKVNKKSASKVTKLKSAGIGHNGKVNKPLLQHFDDYAKMDEDKKAISKAQRDIRARAKEEHGVDKEVFMHEVKMRKKAPDARVMFEQGHADLKDSLGYQHVLPLLEGEEGSEEEMSNEGGNYNPEEEAESGEEAA